MPTALRSFHFGDATYQVVFTTDSARRIAKPAYGSLEYVDIVRCTVFGDDMEPISVGFAVCATEDIFDFNTGARLALYRALNRLDRIKIDWTLDMSDEVFDAFLACAVAPAYTQAQVQELMNARAEQAAACLANRPQTCEDICDAYHDTVEAIEDAEEEAHLLTWQEVLELWPEPVDPDLDEVLYWHGANGGVAPDDIYHYIYQTREVEDVVVYPYTSLLLLYLFSTRPDGGIESDEFCTRVNELYGAMTEPEQHLDM